MLVGKALQGRGPRSFSTRANRSKKLPCALRNASSLVIIMAGPPCGRTKYVSILHSTSKGPIFTRSCNAAGYVSIFGELHCDRWVYGTREGQRIEHVISACHSPQSGTS